MPRPSTEGPAVTQPLPPDDPAVSDRATVMMRGRGNVASVLRRGELPSPEPIVGPPDYGRVQIRWHSDDAVVGGSRTGLATRFRLQAKRRPDGSVVLHGRAS